VKRYSSGMYVRLAFGVAAHLDPEILIVDEVLAVGDAAFQKKCLNKMEEVGQKGRTVLFVSHSTAAVQRLCQQAILLEEGRVLTMGRVDEVVRKYSGSGFVMSADRKWDDLAKAPGNDIVRLCSVRVRSPEGHTIESLDIRRPVGVEMVYQVLKSGSVLVPNFHFYNGEGVCVFIAQDNDPFWRRKPRPVGRYVSTAWIPGNYLAEGTLIVGAAVSTHNPVIVHCFERDAVAFQVVDSFDGDSARGDYRGPMAGIVRPILKWQTRSTSCQETAAIKETNL
jgi:lipopolysaccharide transport system ATP-binding protein